MKRCHSCGLVKWVRWKMKVKFDRVGASSSDGSVRSGSETLYYYCSTECLEKSQRTIGAATEG